MSAVTACKVSELPAGQARQISVGKKKIALFHCGGSLFAIDDACPHRGASLAEGHCEGTEVVCPLHAARFDLRTGAALCLPARQGVGVYQVEVVGDEIRVAV